MDSGVERTARTDRSPDMIAWLKRELAYRRRVHAGRVDGMTAVQACNGWYTRHRTDL